MDSQGQGRARGRGRGQDPLRQAQSRALSSAQSEQPPQPAWSLTSGGPRPPVPRPASATLPLGRASAQYPSAMSSDESASSIGRGLKRSSEDTETQSLQPSGDDFRTEAKRGSLRGKRQLHEKILITRPANINTKIGCLGEQVVLTANYFRLIRKPTWQIYQYHVDFKPEVLLDRLRKYLIFTLKDELGGYLFDGTQLYLIKRLEGGDVVERAVRGRDDTTYMVIIKYIKQVSMHEAAALQIMNLILRRSMAGLKLQLIGRNFFDPDANTKIPEFHLELWPGYTTSIRQHEQDILLCAEITHKVMRTETIYDIMAKIKREERDFKKAFLSCVLGTTVLTSYNNKTYRIDDINFDMKPSDTFETKTGRISFVEYYKTRYNIIIRDQNQPLIISKAKLKDLRGGKDDMILLIPELCCATGITDTMKANFKLMKAMSDHTRVGPAGRTKKLLDFNRRLNLTPDSKNVLTEWDLKLDTALVEIPGRILPNENIVFGDGKKARTNFKVDWTPEFRNNSMYCSYSLKRWHVITTQRSMREARDFVNCVIQAARGMKFDVSEPRMVDIEDDRQGTYTNALEKCANENPQLIMCVVSNNNADRYSSIKKKCCVDRPIPTQVVCQRTITPKGGNVRSLLSIATKVAIQMNCKLGGMPWSIEMPVKGLMTIGFDVCHDSRDKKRSYGALVATMDLKESAEFFSAVSPHGTDKELSDELVLNVNKALKQYREIHGTLPNRICFFRDGVGEGQTNYVFEHELSALKDKLNDIYRSAGVEEGCKLIFIIVSKRINTRIFAKDSNPLPGTVVDDVITLPERYDFFLISQSVREGTVTPTSYNVIYDTMGFPAERIQMLAYKFTHLYYNWSGTVRVPALCQYAHKLAALVAQSVHQCPNPTLERKLFFL